MATTILQTENGRVLPASEALFDALLTRVQSGDPKILMHVHGGLVSAAVGVAHAERLGARGEDSYDAPEDWEQVYPIWRTGFLETIRINWREIASNQFYEALTTAIWQYVKSRFPELALPDSQSLKGATGSGTRWDSLPPPRDEGAEVARIEADLEAELKQDPLLMQAIHSIEASAGFVATKAALHGGSLDGARSFELLDPFVQAAIRDEQVNKAHAAMDAASASRLLWYAVKVGIKVIRRYWRSRAHGLHATIVEETLRTFYASRLGAVVWSAMVNDAVQHFDADGMGSRLFTAIGQNPNARVVMVCHSAGSIMATELLDWAERRGMSLNLDLVFLAPAVRISRFAKVLTESHLSRVRSFRVFSMEDDLERRDTLLKEFPVNVYPSSLLYFVSGVCETGPSGEDMPDAPLLGMRRFFEPGSSWLQDRTEGSAIKKVATFLSKGSGRLVVSKCDDGPGLRSEADSHGEFHRDRKTLSSVRHLLE